MGVGYPPICEYGGPLAWKCARSRREWHHPVALLAWAGGKNRDFGNRNLNGGLAQEVVRFSGLFGHGEKFRVKFVW